MMRARWLVLPLLLLASSAGCGEEVSKPAKPRPIARVGGATITIAEFQRAWRVSAAQYREGGGPVDQQVYAALKRSVLSDLIEDEWLNREAAAQGLTAPTEHHIRTLRSPSRLARRAVDEIDANPSQRAIAAFYQRHRARFVQPESRVADAIVADSFADARRARRALEDGESWSSVGREFGSAKVGRRPLRLVGSRDSMDFGLRKPVFEARRGKVAGPAKAQSGWYVLQVRRVEPARQLSLTEARTSIASALGDYRRQRAAVVYWRQLRLSSRRLTVCLRRLAVPQCRNGSRADFDADGVAFGPMPDRPELPRL